MLDRFTNVKGLGLFCLIIPHLSARQPVIQSSEERECQLACPFAAAVSCEAHTFYAFSRGFWPTIPVLCRLYVPRIFGYSLRFLNLFPILFRSTYSSPTQQSFCLWNLTSIVSFLLSLLLFFPISLNYSFVIISQSVSQSLPSLGLICLFPYLPCPCLSHCMNISCKSLYRCFSSTCCVAVIRPRFSPFLS